MAGLQQSPFAVLLKRYRAAAGLTQEELARQAGVSARAVSALERGVNLRPHRDTVRLLADALQLTAEERSSFAASAQGTLTHPGWRTQLPPLGGPGISLVGRSQEMRLIEEHLRGVGPPVLLLAGEPGIGKTRLLREAKHQGRLSDMTVLRGGCQRGGSRHPYSPLVEALARHVADQPEEQLRDILQTCAWLVRLLPELEGILPAPVTRQAPEQERRLVFRAVADYLGRMAGPGGTLLVLDDLHWAGSDALDLLLGVAQAADELPIRVIGAYRHTDITAEVPLASALSEMAQRDLARRVLLGPLSPEEAAELLAQLLGGEEEMEPQMREQLLRRAEGVPFFLVSLAQSFRAGTLTDVEGALPWSIAESIRHQVAALPEVEQEVLSVAAVAGRVVPRSTIMAVVAQSEARVAATLETVCRAGLLREKGTEAYRFAHDIIREAVEADLGAARRAMLHRQIAETLEQLPERERDRRSGELAWHFRQAGDLRRAFQYSVTAGDQAEAVFAHREAEHHFGAALALAHELGDEPGEAAVLEKLGAVMSLEAKYREARDVLEQAAEIYRAAGDLERVARVTSAIAGVYSTAGWTSGEALQRLRWLIEALQAAGPYWAVPGLYAGLASLLFLSGRYQDQLAAAEQAVEAAAELGDPGLATEAEYFRAFALFLLGRLEESLHVYAAELRRLESAGDLFSLCSAVAAMAVVHLHMGDLDVSRSYSLRAVELADRVGSPWQICDAAGVLALNGFLRGEWAEARRGFERVLSLGEHSRLPYALWQLGWLELAQGDWERARQTLEESMVAPRRTGNLQVLRWAESLLAELDLLQGHPGAARDRLLPLLDRPGLQELDVTFLLPRLAWAYMDLGDMARAGELAGEAVERGRRQHHHLALADALRVQGAVMAHGGNPERAATVFEDAVALSRTMPYPYAAARALYEWGKLECRRGDSEHARQRLEEALTIFQRLGARPYIERTEQALAGS